MFLFILKRLFLTGQSIHRAQLDYYLKTLTLEGDILDLGAGGVDMYSEYIPRTTGSTYTCFDNKQHEKQVDFETDTLPYADNQFDTLVLLNVLEHIFNHQHLLNETRRITSGALVGSVPFIKWYHRDPHDYFRYTDETLKKLFENAGYTDVTIKKLAIGPYTTAFEQIRPTLPTTLRAFVFVPCYGLDMIFKKVRPSSVDRYVLDYLFICK